jgi:subtilisin-like proprotein convertase family protein
VGAATLLALLATPAAALAVAPGPAPGKGALDARAGDRAPVPAATADARDALDRRLGPQSTLSADPVTGGLRNVGRTDGFLTGPSDEDAATIALDYVRDNATAFGLDGADIATLRPAAPSTSPDGITHVTFQQRTDGIPAYDSALSANVAADGRLLSLTGAPVHDLQPPATDPPLGPAAARSAAQRDLGLTPDGDAGTVGTDAVRTTTFPDGDRASLVTLADPDGDRLAWKLTVDGEAPYMYEMLVDAATGAILGRHSLTEFASSAQVFANHPGALPSVSTTDGIANGVATTYTMPSGWLESATPTRLAGPNAHAYADRFAPDGIGGDAETGPSASTNFNYPTTSVPPAGSAFCPTVFTAPCTWDGTSASTAATNANQVTTQVFFFVNRYHDWLAQAPIGFSPASYNFETADPVNAESDDSSGTNNANMSTPSDGTPARMQMYLFSSPSSGWPAVNGGDDAGVVYHEYTHGLTNRLVGGDGQANGLQVQQSRAMGEGWSDWYALDYLTAQGLIVDNQTAGSETEIEGDYVTNNAQTGIRFNAIDCPVGVSSSHCPGTTTAGTGGFTYADLGKVSNRGATRPYFEVHSDGEIWAETLWDLRVALVAANPSTGAATARGLITGALRVSPKQPSFLDMRNAILAADTATGGTHRAQIWSVFAARGMGFSASTTSGGSTRAVAAFDTPPVVAAGAVDAKSLPLEADTVIRVPITNPGTSTITGVRATLSATTGATVPQPTAELGALAAGSVGSATFTVRVPAGAGCGAVAGFSLALTSSQGAQTTSFSIPVGTGSVTAASATYAPTKPIPDNSPTNGISPAPTLAIGTPGRIGALRVALGISHTYIGDLHVWLTTPAGTDVQLLENPGKGNGVFGDLSPGAPLVLDDAAPAAIQDTTPSTGVISGSYKPDQPLSTVAGESRVGTWTLHVADASTGDVGQLTSWSLTTDEPSCAVTDATGGRNGDAATFHGRLDPGTSATSAAFDFGPTTSYGGRSGLVPLTTAGGLQDVATAISGLTPGQTYHVRAVALRGDTVVATGADQAFVAGADDAPPPAPPALVAPPVTPPTVTPPVLKVPKATIKGIGKTLRLDRKGRLVLSFTATPARAKSSLKITAGKLAVGSKSFTVPTKGKVKLTITLGKKAKAKLRKAKSSLKVKLAFRIGTTALTSTVTIKPYKKK